MERVFCVKNVWTALYIARSLNLFIKNEYPFNGFSLATTYRVQRVLLCWLDGVADLVLPPSVVHVVGRNACNATCKGCLGRQRRRRRRRCVSYIYVELIYQTISLYIIARMQMQMMHRAVNTRAAKLYGNTCMYSYKEYNID